MRRRDLGAAVLALPTLIRPARAEAPVVRVSKQYGLGYMSMMVMEKQGLIEQHAARVGIPGLKAEWSVLGGPGPQIDALLAGQVDFIGPGSTTLATLWDKTFGTPQEVRALSALQCMPFVMVTKQDRIRSIADLTEKDRIALPGVKITGHALTLEMAAAQMWGFDRYAKLDPLTVTLAHPDAMAAVAGGLSEITCHFASSPFYYYELAMPGMHQVLKSYDVTGGKHTNGVLLATRKFHDANPKICAAVLGAQKEANAFIQAEPRKTAELYLAMTGDKQVGVDRFTDWVRDPDVEYTTVPLQTMAFAAFMQKVGRIKRIAPRWQDMYFEESHDVAGS
ncbi:MAG: ABC transporter substrate-binding protein [Rhodospirillales bacterium]